MTSRKRKSSLWLHEPKSSHKRRRYDKPAARTSIHFHHATSTPSNASTSEKPSSIKLRRAPQKEKQKKQVQGKRKLFSDALSDKINEITELLPCLLKKLQDAGIVNDFCQLVRLICEGKFPLDNIALLLLLDVVRWYSLESTTQMTYRGDTLKFWKVLYRLFHGKTLRFLSGMKSSGHVVTGECAKGSYSPQHSRINFAVPSRTVIAQYKPTQVHVPDEVPPGIIQDSVDMADTTKSYVLSMDGKKLAPGLSRDKGDINLFGFEPAESLESTKERLGAELKVVEDASRQWSSLSKDEQV